MSLLSVRQLRTHYRTESGPVRAVDGVDFDVQPGEVLGVVGESGSGKSVTALSVMRLIRRSLADITGEVIFDGVDILRLDEPELRKIRGRRMAMAFQDAMTALNPVLTVGQQVTEALEVQLGLTGRAAERRAAELLELVGIPEPERRLKMYPHQFSGGMRQRIMIAVAISCKPQMLFADEVTTALDVTIQAQILQLLKSLTAELGMALVLITHDLGIIAGMADRVNVMYAGRIVETCDVDELFARPLMPYTWGLINSVPRIGKTRGSRLLAIEGQPPDLRDSVPGCRFADRCRFVRSVCQETEPDLRSIGDDPHLARCWATRPASEGGWLGPDGLAPVQGSSNGSR